MHTERDNRRVGEDRGVVLGLGLGQQGLLRMSTAFLLGVMKCSETRLMVMLAQL